MKHANKNVILRSVCSADGRAATSTEVELTSPNWPADYDNNIHCYYDITAPTGRAVERTFYEFMFESNYDYVEVSSHCW